MKQAKTSTAWTDSRDRTLTIASLAIAAACATQIGALGAIPVAIALLMLPLAVGMLAAISYSNQEEYDQQLIVRQQIHTTLLDRKILFRSRFRPLEGSGTQWEIRNANPYSWHNAKLLIERVDRDGKHTERVNLGQVNPNQTVSVEAELPIAPTARWRVMVICQEGQMVDFPSRWGSGEVWVES